MDEKQAKQGHYTFAVEPFQEDATGHLAVSVLGNLLLRCANVHAGSVGYGYRDMIAHGKVWVLARLQIELNTMPMTHETYDIHTWFASCYRQFSDRHYRLTDSRGVVFARALTVWSLIDTTSRLATDLCAFDQGRMAQCCVAHECALPKLERVRVHKQTPVFSLAVRFSDLDINGHVNSIRYISHALDFFDLDFHRTYQLTRCEVAYSAEAYFGDTLHYYHEMPAPLTHHFEVHAMRSDHTTAVVCRICLVFVMHNTHNL